MCSLQRCRGVQNQSHQSVSVLPTHLDSAEIRARFAALPAQRQAEIRARALFSARMASADYLQTLQRVLAAYAEGELNAAEARERLRAKLQALGLDGGSHALTDPGSLRRLNLILRTQRQMAASAARLEARDSDELADWPAWRLERYGVRRTPRADWPQRWHAAGEATGWQGACKRVFVALKTSPIWQALGAGAGGFTDTLGNPYPPFAYGSGMDWTDVDAEEAERLGLKPDGQTAAQAGYASLSPSDQEVARALRNHPAIQALLKRSGIQTLNRRTPFHKCPTCGRFAAYDGTCSRCGAALSTDQQVQRGREALSRATQGRPKDVRYAMHKPGLGSIHFLQGWEGKGIEQEHGKGLAKLQQKHRKELNRLPETIAKGKVYRVKLKEGAGFSERVCAIIHGSYVAFLSKHGDGWAVVTHYNDEKKAREIETYNR